MNTLNPLISIIIPVYNGDRYISEAINSVLQQTYNPIEIIVIDDGSTDKTAEVVKSFGSVLKYFYQENSGTATARNSGISLAKGNFFAFLDADDIWVENKLKIQMEIFNNNPEVDLVFGQVKQFYSPELDENIKKQIYCNPKLMTGYIPSAMIIKRDAFFRVGKFQSQWQQGEFADWYIRATELNLKIINPPNLVAKRRLHKMNKGLQQRQASQSDYLRIIKASLDRKRQQKKEN
ncbi:MULTISPECIES: glycosyltransferase family A protein [unclassified Okeania]|uniref:glycosyltransferase family 2 protein n=1 Tax=unclassified Okeania TaxID=2634635 RepID=UPI0013BB9CA6|nr:MULTISPECIES: glycosyltransferase family A protein [unclassified Okeania]NES76795.1 glycosyltransferase family 2 protein [Okeania sp. SIO1H4]NET11812.1 glycosyltransferase family 2 protein [Okeania sp. SIO1H6]NET20423.1 glycosyltransferase family 2 protein [Okeania sp. SIO1H5]NET94574.1 glycosyltransferase family 2 protein [Okeania sp. SIO1H2]